ncbi:MAG: hypothetical protein ACFFBD_05145 [Candidatus Hodarchaeota archaeon]
MKDKICLSVFDVRFGPRPVFLLNVDEEDAKSIALKSVFAICGTQENITSELDGILPFPEQDLVFYTYLFSIKLKVETRTLQSTTASLTFLVPKSKEFLLYENVAFLKLQVKDLVDKIQKEFIYEEGGTVPKSIAKILTDWNITKRMSWQTENDQESTEVKVISVECPECKNKREIKIPKKSKNVITLQPLPDSSKKCSHIFDVYYNSSTSEIKGFSKVKNLNDKQALQDALRRLKDT